MRRTIPRPEAVRGSRPPARGPDLVARTCNRVFRNRPYRPTAEVNVVTLHHLWPRSLMQSPLTEADRRMLRAYALEQRRWPHQRISVAFDDVDLVGPPADLHGDSWEMRQVRNHVGS